MYKTTQCSDNDTFGDNVNHKFGIIGEKTHTWHMVKKKTHTETHLVYRHNKHDTWWQEKPQKDMFDDNMTQSVAT